MSVKVITHFGIGSVEKFPIEEPVATVSLQKPFLNQETITLSRGEVFALTPWAIVRVLNISGRGWFSNIQFHLNSETAKQCLLLPSPPDETTFFLDLLSEDIAVNRALGILAHDFLWIKPWLDRWGQEENETFEDRELAISSFQRGKEAIAGATGVHTQALLDMRSKKVLWFYIAIAPPEGVIVERKFI